MATMREVAALAGVSIATVSMALNNKPNISKATREKVYAAAKQLNYLPNTNAKRLMNKVGTFGVVFVSHVSYTVYSTIFQGINNGALGSGFDVLSMDEDYFIAQEQNARFLENSYLDGLIILGRGFSDQLTKAVNKVKIPVVVCPERIENTDLITISPDNFGMARMATEYLIKFGHRKIGFIGSHQKYWFSAQRFQGYLSALYDNDLDFNMELVANGFEPFCNGGYEAMRLFLRKASSLPTALFVVNDFMAMGAVKALKEVGIGVPEDISVISCDDVQLSQYFEPPLTTFRIGWAKIGELAASVLDKYVTTERADELLYLTSAELVERDSVRKLG